MKRWRLLAVTLILAALATIAVRHGSESRAQKRRDAAYQIALQSYSAAIKPGMTRKDVEAYLRARGIRFRQMCCADENAFSKNVYDDLVKIGQEDVPFVCSENNVYVAFQFVADRPPPLSSVEESDRLKTSIFSIGWKAVCREHRLVAGT